jgi:hypothetical protein
MPVATDVFGLAIESMASVALARPARIATDPLTKT